MGIRSVGALTAVLGLLSGCGEAAKSATDPIVGKWEFIGFALGGARPDAPTFSYDDVHPSNVTRAEFRADGLFTMRHEGDGVVASIVGTWKRLDDATASSLKPKYRLRIAMLDGAPVPPEARVANVESWVVSNVSATEVGPPGRDPATHRLWLPLGVDPSTRRFKETFGPFKRETR